MPQPDLVPDPSLVAACGLYCGACKRLQKGTCPGCRGNDKASWCKIRTCCQKAGYGTCADCAAHPDPSTCGDFDNFMARIFGLLFRSDRKACILKIRELGPQEYAIYMAGQRRQSMPRK